MHDHSRVEVFEPEVILTVVAQVAHDRDGLLLGLLTTQTLAFQALEVAQDAAGGLDHVAGFQRLGRIKVVMALLEHQAGENHQHQDGCQQDQPQTAANGNIAQAEHGQLHNGQDREMPDAAVASGGRESERVVAQFAGDQQALDLAGAFVDLGDARVAVVTLHRVVLQVAVATMDLQGAGAHAFGHFRSE